MFFKYVPLSKHPGFEENTLSHALVMTGLISRDHAKISVNGTDDALMRVNKLIIEAAGDPKNSAVTLDGCYRLLNLEKRIAQLIAFTQEAKKNMAVSNNTSTNFDVPQPAVEKEFDKFFAELNKIINVFFVIFIGRTDIEKYKAFDKALETYKKAVEALKNSPNGTIICKNILTLVAASNCDLLLQDLVELGADVNKIDGNGNSPLTFAIEQGHLKSLEVLLACAADPEKIDGNKQSPLVAVDLSKHDFEIKNQMLEMLYKAINAKHDDTKTPEVLPKKKAKM